MQKLINQPVDTVTESLQGFELAYPQFLRVQYDPAVVLRKDAPILGKVAVVSGSGSGHEPLNVGYVGRGMLDAACPGAVFTSPTPDQYLAALHATNGGAGALFIVKNYTGGVLNTEMAMELAREEDIAVRSVLVYDDVAVDDEANRRGMGAAVLIEKIAGAAAERGADLATVATVAQRTSEQSRSMGVALSSCTSPSVGRPTFDLPSHYMELGVGIHGEQGRQRVPLAPADQITEALFDNIRHDLGLRAGDQILAMVSGLGATPHQELYIVFRRLHQLLTKAGMVVARQLVGNYVTSLDMAGCTITLLRLDEELIQLWDEPVFTPALRW